MHLQSALAKFDILNKRVFLRADLNVPLDNGTILNDYRLQAIVPTIDYILSKSGTIVLATHIGRPSKPCPELSTQNLLPWFRQRNYSITFESDLDTVQRTQYPHGSIILLENLRFFAGEQQDDRAFAESLAKLGDFYVNDAFATLHRNDSSVVLVPQLFSSDKRTIGFLVEKELTVLQKLTNAPKQPYVLILGGGKVADKLPLLHNLLPKVSSILLCPAIVFSFAKAEGKSVGKSLVDKDALNLCAQLLEQARQKQIPVLFPIDYEIAFNAPNGPLDTCDADNIPDNALGVSIGPKTIAAWRTTIMAAQTIFFNAAMGFSDRPETWNGAQKLLRIVGQSPAFSVIGGGDSVTMAQTLDPSIQFGFFSTGGGATLTYLSGKPLPGLSALGLAVN